MATAFLSDQETLYASNPSRKVGVDIGQGKIITVRFSKTLAASGLATGDTIQLGRVPAGATILGGAFVWDTAQGATATTAIGTTTSAAKYFAAAVTNALTPNDIARTTALAYGTTLTADEILLATNAAAAWTASSILRGHFSYTKD